MFDKTKKHEKIYQEDKTGRLTLITEIRYDKEEKVIWNQQLFPSGEIQSESEFEYDQDKIIREKTWNELGQWTEVKYLYNEDNQLVYRTTINANNDKEVYEKVISESVEISKTYDADGMLYQKEIAYYNENSKDFKRLFYEYNKLMEEHEYLYDSTGNMSQKIMSLKDKPRLMQRSKTNYEYDSNGNITLEVNTNEEGTIRYKKESIFDTEDLLQKEIENDFEGSYEVLITTYEYDRFNRLVRVIVSNNLGKAKYRELNVYNEDGTEIQNIIMAESESFDRIPEKKLFRIKIEYY